MYCLKISWKNGWHLFFYKKNEIENFQKQYPLRLLFKSNDIKGVKCTQSSFTIHLGTPEATEVFWDHNVCLNFLSVLWPASLSYPEPAAILWQKQRSAQHWQAPGRGEGISSENTPIHARGITWHKEDPHGFFLVS